MAERSVRARYAGGSRFELSTGTGHAMVIDDGIGNGGPRPAEALLASLAACAAMDVAALLAKKRQPFTAYAVEARGTQQAGYPQVFTWIELLHVVEGPRIDDAAVRRSIELSATKYCPISAMVSAGPTEIHHRYRIHDTSREPVETREGDVAVTGPNAPVWPAPP